MLVSLYRYNPETDNAPYMQDVELDIPERKGPDGSGCP